MRVQYGELGDRPAVMTRARLNAPGAGRALVDMLASCEWGHVGYVWLDWTGVEAFRDSRTGQVPPALDKATPVMYIQVARVVAEHGATLWVEDRVDIEEVFSKPVITKDDLEYIVIGLRDKVLDELRKRKES
jgi:hypothetical protein